MPPIQPSLRGSLLTGASAFALSLSASGAQAQGAPPNAQPPITAWIEAALFWTAGGGFNIPSVPGLGAPYTIFNPKGGFEGAFGFDYRWPNQNYHFIVDFRYGRTKSSNVNSSAFTPSTFGSSSTSSHITEHESHTVADFMIGRDLGIGANNTQLQLGIRIADLYAAAQLTQTGQSTFYSFGCFCSVTAPTSASGNWSSKFFGVGPRLAVTGDIPIGGPWTFDYSGGVAALFGNRMFNASVTSSTNPIFVTDTSSLAFVFNADGWAALSYWFTPQYRLSGGMRGDYYSAPLLTYNINSSGTHSIDRLYWGPFLRLTGSF